MLKQLAMPPREEVEQVLLKALVRHGGVVKEFSVNESLVDELAVECRLNESQRVAFLETIYRKENRRKRSNLWHRLLFRAADSLANEGLACRPGQTLRLTGKKEWMLTERGFDQALALSNISAARKEHLPIKSFEVEKVVKKLFASAAPKNYDPVDANKTIIKVTRESALRLRGFRQAVIQAYDNRCAVCGFKLKSPDSITWEVQAAHIVPNGFLGRDDIWNGIALCHLHHWSFDVGWFSLEDDYRIIVASTGESLTNQCPKIGSYDFIRALSAKSSHISLPKNRMFNPHKTAMGWHRQNVFYNR